jgi:hypothetical protein
MISLELFAQLGAAESAPPGAPVRESSPAQDDVLASKGQAEFRTFGETHLFPNRLWNGDLPLEDKVTDISSIS